MLKPFMQTSPTNAELDVTSSLETVRAAIQQARFAQQTWQEWSLAKRLQWARKFRGLLVQKSSELVDSIDLPSRQHASETLAAEIIPLADAAQFLERNAKSILSSRKSSRRDRPGWLRGVQVSVQRDPLGVVLVVGASNYPIYLVGVQMLQALVAGNAVVLKPGRSGTTAARCLIEIARQTGLPTHLLTLLPEDPSFVEAAIQVGVDKVCLTGSRKAGQAVLAKLAATTTPATMELSGCDSMWVISRNRVQQAAQAVAFGLDFNQSQTCIAPRRIFVLPQLREQFNQALNEAIQKRQLARVALPSEVANHVRQAEQQGARRLNLATESETVTIAFTTDQSESSSVYGPVILDQVLPTMPVAQADIFAPVASLIAFESMDEAIDMHERCPYALGCSIFGDEHEAQLLASRLNVGCVVINDLIAPTADPRVPFGGRRKSGFGVTRGPEGLLEMTTIRAVVNRRSRWLPHFEPTQAADEDILYGYLGWTHSPTLGQRFRGLKRLMTGITNTIRKPNTGSQTVPPEHEQPIRKSA